ncbi:MAG: hypothetical protein HY861_02475 [Chlamydiia bacterium]|nr:hypothetical protein [Chlamydiia bacterium]
MLPRLCNFFSLLAYPICSRTFGHRPNESIYLNGKGVLTPYPLNKRLREQICRGQQAKKVAKSRLRQIFGFFFLLSSLSAHIDPSDWQPSKASTEEESLFLRRIADFWQEGEYKIAKSQMEAFLSSFPESPYADPLRAVLGDLLLREKNYSEALKHYLTASLSPPFKEKTFLGRMQCLYYLGWHSSLADACEAHLNSALPNAAPFELEATYFLAIALYHQCLNAPQQPDILLQYARRAEPYFETLLHSPLSSEVSQAFAHLCCILKEYPKAARLYLDLAKTDSSLNEEMLFQAALIQAEYDKELALKTFEEIAQTGASKAQEAAYNHLILSFDMGKHQELIAKKEDILNSIPEERKGLTHLFLGRSFLSLKHYKEAIPELLSFLEAPPPQDEESQKSALLCLLEAASQADDLQTLGQALTRLAVIDPSSPHIEKARYAQALLLKKMGAFAESRVALAAWISDYPDSQDKATALFEWADLEYRESKWQPCREISRLFLSQFPRHEEAPAAWRYLAAASERLTAEHPETASFKEQYAHDLTALLQEEGLFPPQEINDWRFHFAKARFDLGDSEGARETLQPLLNSPAPFAQDANATLLFAICARNQGELSQFCEYAELALAKQANLLDLGALHIALFNAYLDLANKTPALLEKSENHLYEAFISGAAIPETNLLWLAESYLSKFENNFSLETGTKAALLFSSLLEKPDISSLETPLYKLGKLQGMMGHAQEQVALMEKLCALYASSQEPAKKWEKEAYLQLAEGYAACNKQDRAWEILEQITKDTTTLQSETDARAHLKKTLLQIQRLGPPLASQTELYCRQPATLIFDSARDVTAIATQLKDLMLQRKLSYEPVHLEAALEYIALLEITSENKQEKRLHLLEKVKSDFESSEDLLSKDYQQSRLKLPEKNRIYEGYMRFIAGDILLTKARLSTDRDMQKELQAKGKDLLLQIASETVHPLLSARIAERLQNE